MKINTALILCAGFGKRLNPLTIKTPKPLLELKNITMLENCINTIKSSGIKKIIINTFHLEDQILDFINNKNFQIEIQIVKDGDKILNTGGGILNMINHSKDDVFFVFNPDTLWSLNYVDEIKRMQEFYFEKKLDNVLLVINKQLSFDKNLQGDFKLEDYLLSKNGDKNFVYTGCQILNKNLFKNNKVFNFPILDVWEKLLKKNELNGFESLNKFYHLTNLDIFKKLKDL